MKWSKEGYKTLGHYKSRIDLILKKIILRAG